MFGFHYNIATEGFLQQGPELNCNESLKESLHSLGLGLEIIRLLFQASGLSADRYTVDDL